MAEMPFIDESLWQTSEAHRMFKLGRVCAPGSRRFPGIVATLRTRSVMEFKTLGWKTPAERLAEFRAA